MSTFVKGWYLIYTKSRHEKVVASQLQEKKVDNFLPLIKTSSYGKTCKNGKLKGKVLEVPMFPSYLFVYLSTMEDYFNSVHVQGYLYYVRFENTLAKVSEDIIRRLQFMCSNCDNIKVTYESLQEGDPIVLKKGPFEGKQCEFIQYRAKNEIIVYLKLLKRTIIATVLVDSFL